MATVVAAGDEIDKRRVIIIIIIIPPLIAKPQIRTRIITVTLMVSLSHV